MCLEEMDLRWKVAEGAKVLGRTGEYERWESHHPPLPLKRVSLNGGTRFYLPSIHNTDFSLWKVLICFHLQNLSKYVLKSNICTLYLNLNTNKTEIILTSKLTVNFHNKTKVENYNLLERKPFVQCWLKGKKAYPQAQTQHNKLL